MYNSGKVSCAFFKVGQLLKKGHFNVSSAVKVAQLLLVCVLCKRRRLCETRRMADYLSQLASSAPSKGHFEAAQMAVGGYLHTAASKRAGSYQTSMLS